MASNVNTVRNPDFSRGQRNPNNWILDAPAGEVTWHRKADGDSRGVTLQAGIPVSAALWSQDVAVKADQYYRIEADVTCDLTAEDESAGLVLGVTPLSGDEPAGDTRFTPGIHRCSTPTALRTYFQAPHGVRRIRISVGLLDAAGTAQIEEVRNILILEPEEISHPIALPDPGWALKPPKFAGSVCVCSSTAQTRPITSALSSRLGSDAVACVEPKQLDPKNIEQDALLLPDAILPKSIGSIAALLKLAEQKTVVVSLPAFASLTKGKASLSRIHQIDDPIHAKVAYTNFATKGFALHDCFPYAWKSEEPGSFVQNQFEDDDDFKALCKRHGLTKMLLSMCDKESTSDQPISLFKTTDGGALVVLDIEPAECHGSTFAEPTLAMHVLLCTLGLQESGLGQYTVPHLTGVRVQNLLRQMCNLFPELHLHEEDAPWDKIESQIVTIGSQEQTYGLPLKPKPVILIRTGLHSGDVESVYGALLWLKQLVRMEPYRCNYASHLANRFQFAWIPQTAQWERREGFMREAAPPECSALLDSDESRQTILIDVVSTNVNSAQVVVPSDADSYQPYVQWLPKVMAAFTPGDYFVNDVPEGEYFTDRDKFLWRKSSSAVETFVDPDSFTDSVHADVLRTGGLVIRIEVPGNDADFCCQSIHRTDLIATLLEQVIGLQAGMVAVNRTNSAINFGHFPPVAPGDALIVDEEDPMLKFATQAG